jgi:hypothetical protein
MHAGSVFHDNAAKNGRALDDQALRVGIGGALSRLVRISTEDTRASNGNVPAIGHENFAATKDGVKVEDSHGNIDVGVPQINRESPEDYGDFAPSKVL